MSNAIIWSGILCGLVAIAGLVWFILGKLKQLNVAQTQQAEQEKLKSERRSSLIESIRVIATAMLEGQVELSEGCIRIKVLLDHFDASLHKEASLMIFETMYKATEHMPTHQARKNTDKNFIHKLDQQRFALEKEHNDAIRKGAQELLNKVV